MADTDSPTDPPLALASIDAMAAEIQATGVGPVTESFNTSLIDAYRANGGQLPGDLAVGRFLLLTTTGARSGKRRTVPLGYVRTEGRTFILASLGGRPENPAWYHNLVANPTVTVELGPDTYEAEAVVLQGDERDRIFEICARKVSNFGDYQRRTSRIIPVIELRPLTGD
ncbi:MAG: nitroreductase family deazaflavin-dependent oxidoreductase [Acidimicrobiales bacterium]